MPRSDGPGREGMTGSFPLPRERTLLLASLISLAIGGWLLVIRQSTMMSATMPAGLTMGMRAPLFLTMWVAMMAAMMFPASAPMILMFDRISGGKRQRGQAFVPTWVFITAYLLVWTVFGGLTYLAAVGLDRLAGPATGWTESAIRLGGILLMLAGVYQFTPLKHVCLSKCRTPLGFILGSWRDGYTGAFRMGLEHGVYCLGCCWFLFVILFPLGVMNVPAMVLLAALIFAEKSFNLGQRIARIAGVALLVYGAVVLFFPGALRTMI